MSAPNTETVRITPGPPLGDAHSPPLLRPLPKPPGPAPVMTAGGPDAEFDSIPRSYFWAIVGLAALIFLIQIWNYVVS